MDNILQMIKRRQNTKEIIIDTFKNEKIELLEKVIKLQDKIDSYKETNRKLKARNRKLSKEIKELREKKEDTWNN